MKAERQREGDEEEGPSKKGAVLLSRSAYAHTQTGLPSTAVLSRLAVD